MGNNSNPPATDPNLIPLCEAIEMNALYREQKNSILASSVDPDVLPICETFGRAAFDAILAQEGCTGIRLYFSMQKNENVCIVGVGVNEDDKDMIDGEYANLVLENGSRCPQDCPPKSDLN